MVFRRRWFARFIFVLLSSDNFLDARHEVRLGHSVGGNGVPLHARAWFARLCRVASGWCKLAMHQRVLRFLQLQQFLPSRRFSWHRHGDGIFRIGRLRHAHARSVSARGRLVFLAVIATCYRMRAVSTLRIGQQGCRLFRSESACKSCWTGSCRKSGAGSISLSTFSAVRAWSVLAKASGAKKALRFYNARIVS